MYLIRTRNHGGCLKVDIVAKTLEGRERANVMYKFKFCKKIDIFISWIVEQKTNSASHRIDARSVIGPAK